MTSEEEVDAFLEHHGIKGQRWGIRNAKSGALSVGRGAKKTFDWSRSHPRTTSSVVAGASFAALLLSNRSKANKKVAVMFPDWSATDRAGKTIHGFDTGRVMKVRVKDIPKVTANPFAHPGIPMGPVGSTGVSRLRGAIPLPKV